MPKKNPDESAAPEIDLADLIRIRPAAKLLGLHPRSIYRLIESGEIRGYRVGARSTSVSRSDLAKIVRPL